MIRDNYHLFEPSYNAAEDTLVFLMENWKDNPKRKGAVNDIRRILSRFQLERERATDMDKANPFLRLGTRIADIIPTHREAKSWIKDFLKMFGCGASIALAVVLFAVSVGS